MSIRHTHTHRKREGRGGRGGGGERKGDKSRDAKREGHRKRESDLHKLRGASFSAAQRVLSLPRDAAAVVAAAHPLAELLVAGDLVGAGGSPGDTEGVSDTRARAHTERGGAGGG